MRRLLRRRKSFVASTVIMGRFGKSTQSVTRPIFRVQYCTLVDDYRSPQQKQLKFMPTLPNYMSNCCCHWSHAQRLETLNSISGFRPVYTLANVLGSIPNQREKDISQQSSPSSDERNSPTEQNSNEKLGDKSPLITRLTMGLASGVLGINGADDSRLLVSSSSASTSPYNRPYSGGYINEAIIESENIRTSYNQLRPFDRIDNIINAPAVVKKSNMDTNRMGNTSLDSVNLNGFQAKRGPQIMTSSISVHGDTGIHGSTPTPPPLPERTDSLNNRSEENALRKAPWFQPGIPREITLEVLSQEPQGTFMVRESTSKPGCYALSLRVPQEFQPSGIAHYLIMRTHKGYKMKICLENGCG
ncbi:EGFR adapter protein-like isoform X2 [Diachasmimorpha longicaudata]|uniref:EGFR adapter protein-like isoform X2 n=1 Tax=Diachasmimorpha longicaudata TaxID=58733 RepID=UPI0030B8DEFA